MCACVYVCVVYEPIHIDVFAQRSGKYAWYSITLGLILGYDLSLNWQSASPRWSLCLRPSDHTVLELQVSTNDHTQDFFFVCVCV